MKKVFVIAFVLVMLLASSCSASVIKGDYNLNGVLEVSDYYNVLGCISGLQNPKTFEEWGKFFICDVNSDGVLNPDDSFILKSKCGLYDNPPLGNKKPVPGNFYPDFVPEVNMFNVV